MLEAREQERKELERALKAGGAGDGAIDIEQLVERAVSVEGVPVLAAAVQAPNAPALLELVDRLKGKLGESAIVLGTAVEGRVHLTVSIAPALVQRGVKAGEIVKTAAAIVGGGGGGRDTLAQAGGREPQKLAEAIEAAEAAIMSALEG